MFAVAFALMLLSAMTRRGLVGTYASIVDYGYIRGNEIDGDG